jgi:mono/diheme cytochrome c family protein
MFDIFDLAAPISAAALLIGLGLWAWRSESRVLKWGGAGFAGVLTVLVVALAVFMGLGLVKLRSRIAMVPELKVAGTASQVHRGKAIADGFCGACHSKTGTLTGGMDVGKDFPVPVGSFVSSNLTPVGQMSHWSDGEIFRAIRNGIDAKGRWLVVMSLTNAGRLSDEDIQALIAYIRSQPPAGEKTPEPPDHLSALGLIMLGTGMLPQGKPVLDGVIKAPAKDASAQYGEYILSYQDCRECHGSQLTGGVQGQMAPMGPGLRLVKDWTLEGFVSTMRTGIDPSGHHLGKAMPWEPIGKMDDEELAAMYAYLAALPD